MVNNVEGCLNENKDNPGILNIKSMITYFLLVVCPYEGWIQLGTKKNLCEFADRFKKTDFLNEASKMSQEEKNLQIIQVSIKKLNLGILRFLKRKEKLWKSKKRNWKKCQMNFQN